MYESVCMYIYIYICIYVCVRVCACMCRRIFICVCVRMFVNVIRQFMENDDESIPLRKYVSLIFHTVLLFIRVHEIYMCNLYLYIYIYIYCLKICISACMCPNIFAVYNLIYIYLCVCVYVLREREIFFLIIVYDIYCHPQTGCFVIS